MLALPVEWCQWHFLWLYEHEQPINPKFLCPGPSSHLATAQNELMNKLEPEPAQTKRDRFAQKPGWAFFIIPGLWWKFESIFLKISLKSFSTSTSLIEAQHSTEMALVLLGQLPRVRILAL